MEKHLLCPMQMRMNGLEVNDLPKFMSNTAETHHIYVPDNDLKIPLRLNGVASTFIVRKPTAYEATSGTLPVVDMTADSPEWDPYDEKLAENEESMLRQTANLSSLQASSRQSAGNFALSAISSVFQIESLCTALQGTFSSVLGGESLSLQCISSIEGRERRFSVTPDLLASRWNIGLDAAKKVIRASTQHGVRDFTNITGMRRLKPTAHQLRYKRLNCEMFTDTFFAPCKSVHGDTCAQFYTTSTDWTRVYEMESKKYAKDTLPILFRTVGVPAIIRPDSAPELIKGEYKKTANRAGAHVWPVEPHTQQHNRAEIAIRETLRMYKRAKRKSGSPKALWPYCLKLVALIRSQICHNNPDLGGLSPEAWISGDTQDISRLCEFAWYEWVWFIDPNLPDKDKRRLGRWLGPSYDVGEEMCSFIFTDKAKVITRTSVWPLSVEDNNSDPVKQLKESFESSVKSVLKDRAEPIARK